MEAVVGEKTLTEDIKCLDSLKDIVCGNVLKQQESTRRQPKQGAPKSLIRVGDQMWRQNIKSQQRKGGKLEANFLGPFKVTAIKGKSADLVGEN